jgi:hypothetical protein
MALEQAFLAGFHEAGNPFSEVDFSCEGMETAPRADFQTNGYANFCTLRRQEGRSIRAA